MLRLRVAAASLRGGRQASTGPLPPRGLLRRVQEGLGWRRPAVDVAEAELPQEAAAPAAQPAPAPAKREGAPLRPGRPAGALFAESRPSNDEMPVDPAEANEPRILWTHMDPPEDPTMQFIKQGRQLLADMEDGGRVACIAKTGVEGVWCLQLENLTVGNTLTGEMMLQLEETLRMVNRAIKTNSDIIALVVRGSGLNFSYGTSPTLHQEKWWRSEGHVLSRYMHAVTLELSSLPIITIAAIEGVCAGTAAELAMACDFRVMSNQGMLQFTDTNVGLTTGWGGSLRAARASSSRAALLMTASGKSCSAHDALELGLVDSVSVPGESYSDALQFVRENLHDHSGLGGTHGEVTWRRQTIRAMKDNIVAADLFESVEAQQGTEIRNFAKTWDLNAKVMTERRLQAIGLRRAGVNRALEDWNVVTDRFATTLPPDEDVGMHGLTPASDNTLWGAMRVNATEAFDAIMERKPGQALPSSPESTRFHERQKALGSGKRPAGLLT